MKLTGICFNLLLDTSCHDEFHGTHSVLFYVSELLDMSSFSKRTQQFFKMYITRIIDEILRILPVD